MNEYNNEENLQPQTDSFIHIPKPYKPAINYWGQLGILLGLTGVGMIVGFIVSIPIWTAMTHTGLLQMQTEIYNPKNADAIKVMQLVTTFFTFFIPAFFYARILNPKPFTHLGFRKEATILQIVYILGITFFALILGGALAELNEMIPVPKSWQVKFQGLEDEYMKEVMAIATMKNGWEYFLSVIIIALIPAIFEEVIFRGALQQLLVKWFRNYWIAIIVTSIFFSAIHLSYYGFLTRAALGMILGLIFYYGKNIWLNILIHFLNNAVGVTELYLLSKKGPISKDAMNDTVPLWIGAIALILVTVFLILFKKESDKMGMNKVDNTYVPSNNPFAEYQ
jgi:membrane protease YdiL (CAAX protease family)